MVSDHYHINNAGVNDMFDVKKLEKLLKDIFTRDNVNFSPELVAEELKRRSLEVFDDFALDNASAMPDMPGDNNRASGDSSCYGGPYVSRLSFELKYKSDPREMKRTDTPLSQHTGFKAESIDVFYGAKLVQPSGVGVKAVTFSDIHESLSRAKKEPSLTDREKFHSEAVAWLAETYHKWPAGDNPGCRDWVLVNKDSEAGWFMPFAITLASGCVVYRSEWADFVNKTRPAKKSVVIGNGCTSDHRYAVVIGSNVSSDKDYQLKIGSNGIQCSRDISQEEFDEIRKVFSALIGK
ncbi:hypothetical protein [Aeromonas phage 62AhydR11PP]|nr:hypothetical protein [Aeromonas phage 62AhydR11PP]